MYLIKTNGGSGTVEKCYFENFIGHNNSYSLDIDMYWGTSHSSNPGIQLELLTFSNWTGDCNQADRRPPVQVVCASAVPCFDIAITDFALGTVIGTEELYLRENAYGSGACLNRGSSYIDYTTTTTLSLCTVSVLISGRSFYNTRQYPLQNWLGGDQDEVGSEHWLAYYYDNSHSHISSWFLPTNHSIQLNSNFVRGQDILSDVPAQSYTLCPRSEGSPLSLQLICLVHGLTARLPFPILPTSLPSLFASLPSLSL